MAHPFCTRVDLHSPIVLIEAYFSSLLLMRHGLLLQDLQDALHLGAFPTHS